MECRQSLTEPPEHLQERITPTRQLPIRDELPEILLELLIVRGQALDFLRFGPVRRRERLDRLLTLDEERRKDSLCPPDLRDVLGRAAVGCGKILDRLVQINHDAIGGLQLPRHAGGDGLRDVVEGLHDIGAADLRELPRRLHHFDDLCLVEALDDRARRRRHGIRDIQDFA